MENWSYKGERKEMLIKNRGICVRRGEGKGIRKGRSDSRELPLQSSELERYVGAAAPRKSVY